MEQEAEEAEVARATVILLDPQRLRREAIMHFLRPWAITNQVSLVATAPENIQSVAKTITRCALVLLSIGGISMSQPTVLTWLGEAEAAISETPTVIMGDCADFAEIIIAARAGARGFLPTSMDPHIALHALTFIICGGSYFPLSALMRGPMTQMPHNNGKGDTKYDDDINRTNNLTVEQQAILVHLQNGKHNREIAELLGLRESTVKIQMRQIMRKLGVSNRTQAALAVSNDMLDINGISKLNGEIRKTR